MSDTQPDDVMNLRLLREIYHRAEACPPAERARLLDEACGTDAALRAEVEALLAANERAGAFLAEPTMNFQPDSGTLVEREALPFPVIGPYQLVEKIGEGGYGEVFLAEQSEPVRRRVALKMLKAGLDTRQVLARFEAERQTLAMMDHPGIARIFDAGTTPQGRPYFVMELVDGVPMTEFCMLRKVTPRERLELFCEVCRAVQHAHAKGVIHRDLKPSNILVSETDGRPRAVVIDFGIAKAMRGLDAGATLHTGLRQLMGTPAYMSPEQAGLEGPDVDTRSDIYSLGVLLYELLTGVTPFDASQLRAAALAEVQRRLNEEVPAKPSTRVASLYTQATQTGLRADFAAPVRLLKGDLDWIVMKALEKEPGRRYATAAAFAEDIVRHLGHEPVTAGPPSAMYRLRKWTRRNRAGAAAAAVMLLATAIAAGGLVRGYVIAKREAAARKVQAERAESLLKLQTQIFESANPETAGGEYTVRQLLEDFSVRFRDPLGVEPEVEISLRQTIGRAWQMLGGSNRPEATQAAPSERERSDMEQAETHFRAALALAVEAQGADSMLAASCRQSLAWLLRDRGFYQKAAEELRPALAVFAARQGALAAETLSAKAMLATVLLRLDERDEAQQFARAAAAWPGDAAAAIQPLQLAARVCLSTGDKATAAAASERALRIARAQPGKADGPRLIQPLLTLAEVRAADGRRQEGMSLAETAHRIARETFGEKHPETSKAMLRLTALRETAAAAAPDSNAAASTLRTAIGDGHPDTIAGMAALMSTLKTEEAREIAEKFAGVPRGGRASGAPVMIEKLPAWVRGLVDSKRLKDFEGVTKGVIEMARKTWGEDHLNTLDAERILAEMYTSQSKYDNALEVLIPNLAKTRRSLGDTHPLTTEGLILIARQHFWKKDFIAMEPLLEESRLRLSQRPQDSTAGYHWAWLAELYSYCYRFGEAAFCAGKAVALLNTEDALDTRLKTQLLALRAANMTAHSLAVRDIAGDLLKVAREKLPGDDGQRWTAEMSAFSILSNTLLWRSTAGEIPILEARLRQPGLPDAQRRGLQSVIQAFAARVKTREELAQRERAAWGSASKAHGVADPLTLAALRTWIAACGNAGGIPSMDDALAELDKVRDSSSDPLIRAETACEAAWYRGIFRGLSVEETLRILTENAAAVPAGESPPGAVRLLGRVNSYARFAGHTRETAPVLDAAIDRMAAQQWPAAETSVLVPRFTRWLQTQSIADPGDTWRSATDLKETGWCWKESPVGNSVRYASESNYDVLTPFDSGSPVLMRTTFKVEDPGAFSTLKLRLRCADGAILWINGREALRRRVPAAIAYSGHASAEPSSPEPDLCALASIDLKLLRPGVNVLAAAVYFTEKRTGASSALLDCALEARRK